MRTRIEIMMPLALITLLGCGRPTEDASRVLANVGGAKITETELGQLVKVLIKDPAAAKAFLSQPDKEAERQDLLRQMAASRAVYQLAQAEGLDRDAMVKAQIEGAVAKVYFNALLERRAGALEPREADLKNQYDTLAAQAKAAGETTIPPFEQVKGQLASRWQQQQLQQKASDLQKELQEKVPMTFAASPVEQR